MHSTRHGKAHVFGDNINTDIIAPPQYMELCVQEACVYAMSSVDQEFTKRVQAGDIVVAGANFGSGSSRELAPLALKHLGVGAVVARSFARIFYRNAINVGLAVVECAHTGAIRTNDALTVDFAKGLISNETKAETYSCSLLPPHIVLLIQQGGLIQALKKQG